MGVNGATASVSGTGASVAFAATPVAGGKGRTFVIAGHVDVAISTITDTSSNTWTYRGAYNFTGAKQLEFWTCHDPIGGSAYQATVTLSSSNWYGLTFLEIIGTLEAGSFDSVNTGNADNSNPYLSNTISPSVAEAILVAIANPDTALGGGQTFTHNGDGFVQGGAANTGAGPTSELSTRTGSSGNNYSLNITAPDIGSNSYQMFLMSLKAQALARAELILGVAADGNAAGQAANPPAGHQADDIILVVVETAGGEAPSLSTANGYAAITGASASTGTGTAGTRLTLFWKRVTSSSDAGCSFSDAGDHVIAGVYAIRGCPTSGDPWGDIQVSSKGTASTSASAPACTVSNPNELVLNIISRANDASGASFSAWSNTDLSDAWEHFDVGTTDGNGGGWAIYAGHKSVPGAVGSTTATIGASTTNASITITFKSTAASGTGALVLGSEEVTWGNNQNPAAQNITVPATCTAVLVMGQAYNGGGAVPVPTFTLNGASPNETVGSGTTTPAGSYAQVWYNPPTGTQSLDLSWSTATSADPRTQVVYLKGISTSGWVDADCLPAGGSAGAARTFDLTGLSAGNLVVMGDYHDGPGAPSLPAGWDSISTHGPYLSVVEDRIRCILATGSSVTCTAQNPQWSTPVAVAFAPATPGTPSYGSTLFWASP